MKLSLEELLCDPKGIRALDDDCFQTVYDMLDLYERAKLTKLLEAEGINPLEYMAIIPKHYMDENFVQVVIPETIKQIFQEAFINCKNLLDVTFNEGLTRIGMLAFSDCEKIQTLDFPKTLEVIDTQAFIDCKNLIEIHFYKENLSFIKSYAFGSCPNLKYITYTGTINEWRAVEIADDAFKDIGTKNIRCSDGIFSIYEDED